MWASWLSLGGCSLTLSCGELVAPLPVVFYALEMEMALH